MTIAAVAEAEPLAADLAKLRVAIVHYWLVAEAGGEKVVREIARIFPQADIFTLIHDPAVSARMFPGHRISASWLQRIPFARKFHPALLPLMPGALEALDLRGYDLIISSESGPAKGTIPPIEALHICYCHSPMRYLWDQSHEYRERTGLVGKLMMAAFGTHLRMWDAQTSQRVDAFIANSNHIARRIARYYRRDATVIHPPVDIAPLEIGIRPEDYYLIAGRHVGYKRIDLAIEAANRLGRRLVVAGSGPETKRLKKLAGPMVEFRGRVSRQELSDLYARCSAFLMPGEEDFGISPIEAMGHGRPVIALGRGGALDSVVPGLSGHLFSEQTADALAQAILDFEAESTRFDPRAIAAHAARFAAGRFRREMTAFVRAELARHAHGPLSDHG